MRIWAFPSFYPYDYPGMRWNGTFAHRQCQGLIENGAELKVIVPTLWYPPFPFSELHSQWKKLQKIGMPYQRVYDGVTVYHPRISNIKPNRLEKRSYLERYVDSIVDFFKREKITLNRRTDIFYSQWLPDAVFAQHAAHQLGIKSAILSIGDDVTQWPNESEKNFNTFRDLMVKADMRFACADFLGREANKILKMDLPYNVTYFGVDYNLFKPVTPEESIAIKKQYNIPLDKTVVLIIGSAIVRKGWLDLLDVVQKIVEVKKDFVLAGGHAGPSDFDVMEEVAKRGLKNYFVNLGEVKPENLNKMYNTADIFCLPSHWEGLATVVMESMSSGVPVITTNVCGHPEIIENGVTGILIPPKDKETLYNELLSLLDDKAKRSRIGADARKFIVNKWGNFKENAEKLYQKLEAELIK